MANFPFVDKYGRLFYTALNKAERRAVDYIIIKRENEILCLYDVEQNIFALPKAEDISLNIKPSSEFAVLCYVCEDGKFFKEQQTYTVYTVANVDISHIAMFWCSINDILLEQVAFDATQKSGLKNILVRS